MSTTLWKLSGDLFLVKPSQFLPVNRASTSDHALCLARAASAVAKNCFSEIWGQKSKVNQGSAEAGGGRRWRPLTLKVCRMLAGLLKVP